MQVSVRPIRTSDQVRWRELWRAYQAFYDVELPPDSDRNNVATVAG